MARLIHVSGGSTLQPTFTLANARISYIFQVSVEGLLEHVHFGEPVRLGAPYPSQPRRVHRGCVTEFQQSKYYSLNDMPQEYPLFGTSDNRQPAVHIINGDGNSTQVFRYQSFQILDGKPELTGLPSAAAKNCQTLKIVLMDAVSKLRIELCYTIYQDHDVITRSSRIINEGETPVLIDAAMSACLDLPAGQYELLHLRGTWAREFTQNRIPAPSGRFVIESANGSSGNVNNPFIAVLDANTSESFGRVFASTLLYSGNFSISVEQGEFGGLRLLSGINPFNFQWQLDSGQSFTTPESVQVYSPSGLNGMSQIWHRFIRQCISPESSAIDYRPSYLNTWEAAYFDIDEAKVLALADRAKELGLQMLVVDDGWFEGRNGDDKSLGDWYSDKRKFPSGITAVGAMVKAKGLKFGLWLEPEMVSPKSRLYRSNPDWAISVPNRSSSQGRNQLILDMSRTEVQDYLFERIDGLLSSGNIDYVKWDMNRTMSEIGSMNLPVERQLETPHRYMLGLYSLLKRIVTAYPEVLFENCASGGNRFDLGMLRFMQQGWLSDMSEPIGRLSIVNGASLLYPLSVMAAYIAPSPSHLNGRAVSLKTRANAVFFAAARGLSLNLDDIDRDFEILKQYIGLYTQTAQDVHSGDFYRLRYEANEVAWQLNSSDGSHIYLGYFHILSAVNLPLRKIQLLRLDADSRYVLQTGQESSQSLIYGGDALMHMGLDMPYICDLDRDANAYIEQGDFASRLFILKRVDDAPR